MRKLNIAQCVRREKKKGGEGHTKKFVKCICNILLKTHLITWSNIQYIANINNVQELRQELLNTALCVMPIIKDPFSFDLVFFDF